MKVNGHGQAKILSPQEIEQLFEEGLQKERDRALFGICLYTACRISEACSTCTKDVFHQGQLRSLLVIRKSHTKGRQGTRSIPIHGQLRELLLDYQTWVGRDYLFPGRHGRGHINPISARAILKEACDRMGLMGVSTHSFRRTALTSMSNSGVPLRVIQEISGHRSLAALQRYLEVSEEQVRGAIEQLNFW